MRCSFRIIYLSHSKIRNNINKIVVREIAVSNHGNVTGGHHVDIYSHFSQNKYTFWYISIITKSLSENRKKVRYDGLEFHHILPISVFPEFKSFREHPWNKVLLTYKEHFICHWLLTKMFNDEQYISKMKFALSRMCNVGINNRIIPSKYFAISKKSHLEALKLPRPYRKGKKLGPQKNPYPQKGIKKGPRGPMPEEHKASKRGPRGPHKNPDPNASESRRKSWETRRKNKNN